MAKPWFRGGGVLAVAVILSACAGQPARVAAPPVPPAEVTAAARAAEVARQSWLQAHPDWSFQGRLALRRDGDGGSGRIDWQQRGMAYTVQLSAPVTRQSWTLSDQGDGRVRIDGLPEGPRVGDDARRLLREATSWDIPVAPLADWVRGLPGSGARVLGHDAQGRLRQLVWQDWALEFLEWTPADDVAGRPALPRRIEATDGHSRVRLVVDDWSFETP